MSDDETRYVFGRLGDRLVLVVATPTPRGWRCRSSAREYQHDYVRRETFDEVMAWMDVDMTRAFLTHREEAREHLSLLCREDPEWCFATAPEGDEERVLRHLERGW